jgi:3-deoxy-D-manno-octulosonic-acid transferase
MLFFIAKKRGDKTILLNARISDNSYRSYKKFSFFYKLIFKHIDEVFAQSQKDADRLREIGATNIKTIGNIKSFADFKVTKRYDKPKNRKIVVLASTHKDEERKILENLKTDKNFCIVVVPRHPERFESVGKYLKDYCEERELSYSSLNEDKDFNKDVILCDKMGELINIYAICDIVILGGSFIEGVGGHNPLEPASFEVPIISGKSFFNQQTLYKMVENIYIANENSIQNLIDKDLKSSYIKDKADIEPVIRSIKNVV